MARQLHTRSYGTLKNVLSLVSESVVQAELPAITASLGSFIVRELSSHKGRWPTGSNFRRCLSQNVFPAFAFSFTRKTRTLSYQCTSSKSSLVMPAATSLPYLPSHLVEQLKKDPIVGFKTSIINFRDTERYRLRVISQKTHPHVPVTGIVPPPEEQVGVDPRVSMALRRWQRTDHKCQLHFAAMELDIPLVHEALRMSNDPSYKDADGVTPLFLALEAARSHIRFGPNVRIEERTRTVLRLSNREVRARVTRIVTLLAEQHGDIDSGFEGRTPLSIAVELSLWEVVEVLLRHGVKTPPIRQLSFKNNDSKVQYLKLVTSIGQVASLGLRLVEVFLHLVNPCCICG